MSDRRFKLIVLMLLVMAPTRPAAADERDIAYGDLPQQKLDVYTAADAGKTARPVVVWVHGGGWRNGDKANAGGVQICKTWAKTGLVMVSVNYRLSPAATHPAHVQDVAAAVAWVCKHIAKYGGDPKKIFLLGHSAGAHLVALVGTNPKYLKAHDLAPGTALSGVMPIDTASYDLSTTRTPLVQRMIRDAFGEKPEALAEASPLLQARKNPQACPPFVVAVCKQRAEALEESTALTQALPRAKLIVMDYPGSRQLKAHGQIARDLQDPQNAMTRQLLAFVKGEQQ